MKADEKMKFTALSNKYPDVTKLFRCGDFYESYFADATKCHEILGICIHRDKEGDQMTVFPHYALDTYLPKLIRSGCRVAICDNIKPKLDEY